MFKTSQIFILKIAIASVSLLLFGCTNKYGKDYFECLIVASNISNNRTNFNIDEICNQVHPARQATEDEMNSLEIAIHSGTLSYKQLEIANKNSDFFVTEVIISFSNDDMKLPIKFIANARPYSVEWTESTDTGINGVFKAHKPLVKGRTYK